MWLKRIYSNISTGFARTMKITLNQMRSHFIRNEDFNYKSVKIEQNNKTHT